MGLPAWFCGWPGPLARISAWTPPHEEIQSTQIWALVAVNPFPLLHLYAISTCLSMQIPPFIPFRWNLNGLCGTCPAMLGELDIHLGLSSYQWNHRHSTSLYWPGRGAMQAECSCFSYPSNAVLLSLCGPGNTYLTSGSWFITVVSYLWIVANWPFCKGDWSWEGAMLPYW